MRKNLLPLLLFLITISTVAKTTYIPKYMSYINIINGLDTISVADSTSEVELTERKSLFCIRIEYEEIDKEKIKAIKRAKRTAGWMTFSAVLSSASCAFSENQLQYYINSQNSRITSQLASIYNLKAAVEKELKIDIWIDNLSSNEIIINDTERGLLWYVRPRQSLHLQPNNPDMVNLRISDIHSKYICYSTIAAGAIANKMEIEWEDDECWISPIYRNYRDDDGAYRTDLVNYKYISKDNYSEREMTIKEFKMFKKIRKKIPVETNN